jgi:TonB family protein
MHCSRIAHNLIGISTLSIWMFFSTSVIPQSTNAAIKPPQKTPLRVGGNASEQTLFHMVHPVYPERAKQERLEGKVILEVIINEEGFVYDVIALPGNNKILEEAAITAVKKWRYRPTYLNGEPIAASRHESIVFSLEHKDDIYVGMDVSGNLNCTIDQMLKVPGPIQIIIDAGTPFRIVENAVITLIRNGVKNINLPAPFQMHQGRLFYSVGMQEKWGSRISETEINRLRDLAVATGKLGEGKSSRLYYKLFFNEAGHFIELQRLEGPEIKEVEKELRLLHPSLGQDKENRVPVVISFVIQLP